MKRFLAHLNMSQTSLRKARRRPAAAAASVERLEPRQLLSGVSGLEQALAPHTASPPIAVDASRWDSSSILVTFRTDVGPESLLDLPAGIEVGPAIDLLPGLREIRLGDSIPVDRALEIVREHWAVLDAEPNYAIGFEATVTPNDPKYTSQWALPKIDAPTAWSATTGSPGVVVAVIDSGVDYNHPDLAANIWRNPGETPGDAIDNDGNGFVDDVYGWDFANNDADPMDDHGHGTHVAGTIAAVGNNGVGVTGVSWQTQVMPLKFLGADGTGYVSDAVAALNYAVAKGAAISNHSWTTSSYSSTLDTAVRNAAASGHIVVAAAGNDGANADNSPHYPAAFSADNLISVAATTSSDGLASFSNYGARSVDLGAPGVSILSTTRGGGYGSMSGTSMAAPHVSGVVALVRSLHPLWSYRRVIDQVLSTTDPVSSLQGKTVTGGRLNAASAVASEALPLEKPAPSLGAATGTVVRVSTESQLQAAVNNLTSNTTILIAPGVYHLSNTLYLRGVQNVAIRGETGNRDDVVLVGRGMSNASYGNVPHGIWMRNVQNALVADLTIRDFYYHPIILNAGTEAPHLYNLRLVDAGEQFIKSNGDGNGGGVDNGIVEYCRIEYTTTARSDYTQGIDVHTGANWIIRHNVFRNIRSPAGYPLAGHAILMWNRSRNTITEGNLLLNCQRGIGYGLKADRPDDHYGGVIRNNFVHRSATQSGDVGISLENSADTKILHNTVILSGTYANAIEYRFEATTGVEILFNLSDGAVRQRNGASGRVESNVTTALGSWFVDAAAGDLHLKADAIGTIDLGSGHASVTYDYDGQVRPIGLAPDIGADEYGSSNVAPVAQDDNVSTAPNASVTIAVLANDTDADGDSLSVSSVTQGSNGSVVANGDGTVTYTPQTAFSGTDSFTYTINDRNGGTGTATVTVTVRPTSSLNLSQFTLDAYGWTPDGKSNDLTGTATIEDGGATLRIVGNRWKKIDFPYTVTANTVLEFDFQSGARGEIHGIGFDTDLTYSPELTFQLYGSQSWGLKNYQYSSAPGVQHFRIPVGQFYTGAFQHLFFVMDHDVSNPTGESVFSNVRVYEDAGSNSPPEAANDTASTAVETAVTIAVLANDTDANGDSLSVSSVTQGGNGAVVINGDGTVTYTPNAGFTGTDSFTYTIDDGRGGSDTATGTVTVSETMPALDFHQYTLDSYGLTPDGKANDLKGTVTIEDGGAALRIVGNRWKKIDFPYTVTTDTVLEFDFQSGARGEIHGIGFDTDLTYSPELTFQLYGSQSWGLKNYQYSSAPGVQHFQIPVGQFYTGAFQHLFFVMDHDVSSPTGESVFSNVRVYEDGASLDFSQHTLSSYGWTSDGKSNDLNGTVTVEDDGAMLRIVGNRWQKIDFPYTVTADTVLEFDFKSGARGDIHGIGFDTDLTYSPELTFQLYGRQSWGLKDYQYSSAPGVQHFRIPVGQFYTGAFQHLFFVMDHDVSSPTGESVFSNVRIYEALAGSEGNAQLPTNHRAPEFLFSPLAASSDPSGLDGIFSDLGALKLV